MKNNYYKAIICDKLGSIDLLKYSQLPKKPLNKGEVRIKVVAAGINFPDFLITEGKYQYKPPLPFTPGMEISGYITESKNIPSKKFDLNKLYIAQLRTGGFAEEVVIPINALQIAPDNFSAIEAGSYFVTAKTAYVALIERAKISQNETILIHGAAGGVGLAATQLALALNTRPIAVVSNTEKKKALKSIGVKDVILTSENIYEKTMHLTNNKGVQIVFDPVGGEMCRESIRCLSWSGRLLIIGFASGKFTNIKSNYVLIKGISVIGVRAGEYTRKFPEKKMEINKNIKNLAEKGLITPRIHKVFKLRDFKQAAKEIKSRQVIGKLAFKI